MGMSSWILDNEEMFYDGAQDVITECESYEEFLGMMKPQLDLVAHLPLEQVLDNLSELWNETWSNAA